MVLRLSILLRDDVDEVTVVDAPAAAADDDDVESPDADVVAWMCPPRT